jgi:hypothetical protein
LHVPQSCLTIAIEVKILQRQIQFSKTLPEPVGIVYGQLNVF